MATLNTRNRSTERTHEGAPAARINSEQQLRRSVMSCMLWEGEFYEDGQSIADRIKDTIATVSPDKVRDIAIAARTEMNLRHVPLLIAREMARLPKHKALVASTLDAIINRPDELTEFLAIYWKDGKQPLSAQVKKGLAAAFAKFNSYSLAKYDRDGAVKIRDVMFLSHPKPLDVAQETVFKCVAERTLPTPDTWEVALSDGADKRTTFERLMTEGKLGALAFLRNLRNMHEAGVHVAQVQKYAETVNTDKVLPFRFIAAANAVPAWEHVIEKLMLRALEEQDKLPGKTAILVDNSGSMHGCPISMKSDLDRSDAACALAILVREVCEDVVVIGYGSTAHVLPARRGFALRDAIKTGPGRAGTDTGGAIRLAKKQGYDRIIVLTDEQSATAISHPEGLGYFINVASAKNGIGYGPWTHFDGFSEAVINYIRVAEKGREGMAFEKQ